MTTQFIGITDDEREMIINGLHLLLMKELEGKKKTTEKAFTIDKFAQEVRALRPEIT